MSRLQLTLAIVKPHIVQNPVALKCVNYAIKKNFALVGTKRTHLTIEMAGEFYKEHFGKFFYNRLVTFMSSGASDVHILAQINAISMWRMMLGPTKVYKTQYEQPDSLRGLFGLSDTRNVAHGSDSENTAAREIGFFFPNFSVENWFKLNEESYKSKLMDYNDKIFKYVVV